MVELKDGDVFIRVEESSGMYYISLYIHKDILGRCVSVKELWGAYLNTEWGVVSNQFPEYKVVWNYGWSMDNQEIVKKIAVDELQEAVNVIEAAINGKKESPKSSEWGITIGIKDLPMKGTVFA